MAAQRFSIILPVYNQADHIGEIVRRYVKALDRAHLEHEVVLVPNGCRDASAGLCRSLAAEDDRIAVIELAEGGWGRAVRAGLAAARGDFLCYTNSARTTPDMLVQAVGFSQSNPQVVVKAQRTIRDSTLRQAGSLLYNLECRVLFGLATWDINGTPKLFPRSYDKLLQLQRDDDLIDAEFVITCKQVGYPIVELASAVTLRHGGRSTTRLASALHMYRGALRMRWDQGRR